MKHIRLTHENLLQCPPALRTFSTSRLLSSDAPALPRVVQPSLWNSLIPKAFRRPNDPVSLAERQKAKAKKSQGWNPATFFIAISIFIGSNAINTIKLRNEILSYNRKTDAKIALLRETIERVQRGEDVDVEKILGTGIPEKEKEWEEVMEEIAYADELWQKRGQGAQQKEAERQVQDTEVEQRTTTQSSANAVESPTPEQPAPITVRRPGYYM
ncbi:hypothetical protein H2203_009040 [Taxawa tesnikishii (nom. ined.)]|nr:hypothetical protein H2203_009040 [Dothideales sp. JES 119]